MKCLLRRAWLVVPTVLAIAGDPGSFAGTPPDPFVETSQTDYDVGEHVVVMFSSAAGSGTDWVGIYPAAQVSHVGSTYWLYTNGSQSPDGGGITTGSLLFVPISLPPGDYQSRFFFNDSYQLEDLGDFRVTSSSPVPAPVAQGDLTVMSFNIWVNAGNGFGGVDSVVDAILEADADLIGFQECNSSTLNQILAGLQQDPGYASAVASTAAVVISRFPIVGTYAAGLFGYGAKVERAPGEYVRIFNAHLTAYPYGPYSARDGDNVQQILHDESTTRAAEMEDILEQLVEQPANEPGLTTFFVGDHNTPSHLDWTPENTEQNFGFSIDWPVSVLLEGAGFIDAHREVFPNPVEHRDFTWSPGYPKDSLDVDDVHDRIDYIYFRPEPGDGIRAVSPYTMDRNPWPSDHRAIVASFCIGGGETRALLREPGVTSINPISPALSELFQTGDPVTGPTRLDPALAELIIVVHVGAGQQVLFGELLLADSPLVFYELAPSSCAVPESLRLRKAGNDLLLTW